jgi:uncharacterized protein (DUF2236 family)
MNVGAVLGAPRALARWRWAALVGADRMPDVQFTDPPGDPGLYGPGSAIWYVHGDVAGLVGGLSGLLLGALHEPTLYGTNQHSSYTDDPLSRLGRTGSFVNAMTYGSTPVAEHVCDLVRTMHLHVHGTMPDGRPYAAGDSDQLIWTAVTQAHCVMRAHQRYHPRPLKGERVDEYYAQYARFAIELGATKPVPSSRAEVEAYFAEMRPLLSFADETAELADFFRRPFGPDPFARAASIVITRAAFDTLPDWAARLYGTRRTGLVAAIPSWIEREAMRTTTQVMLRSLRIALGEPPMETQARARSLAEPPTSPTPTSVSS